jgi:Holliday junction resolvasome RuvABC DNA-binding subunit
VPIGALRAAERASIAEVQTGAGEDVVNDAIDALRRLGFSARETRSAVAEAARSGTGDHVELIRRALRSLRPPGLLADEPRAGSPAP